jgi:hypothetical protein
MSRKVALLRFHVLLAAAFVVDSREGDAHCKPGEFYGESRVDGNGKPVLCAQCMPGYWSSGGLVEDKPACEPCLHGQFSAERGADQCQLCDQGRWQASPGETSCLECPPG